MDSPEAASGGPPRPWPTRPDGEGVVRGPSSRVLQTGPSPSRFGDTVVFLFLCTQALDGVLTYLGVLTAGIPEGNPLLAYHIDQVGIVPSLTMAKLLAAGCAAILHVLAFHRVLAVLTLLYVSCAVVPWTWVLFAVH
jgi:hypothetical protein